MSSRRRRTWRTWVVLIVVTVMSCGARSVKIPYLQECPEASAIQRAIDAEVVFESRVASPRLRSSEPAVYIECTFRASLSTGVELPIRLVMLKRSKFGGKGYENISNEGLVEIKDSGLPKGFKAFTSTLHTAMFARKIDKSWRQLLIIGDNDRNDPQPDVTWGLLVRVAAALYED